MKGKPWLIGVVWEDSRLVGGSWEPVAHYLGKPRKRVRCYSVGYVLADDKRGIVLASSVNEGDAAGVVIIPRSQIVRKWRLR